RLAQFLGDLAGKGVGCPAGRECDHQPDRPVGIGSLRLRQGCGAEHGPCNQTPAKEIAHDPPPSLHPAHGPLTSIGPRAGVCVDWLEPCNNDVIVAGAAYMFASSQSPM